MPSALDLTTARAQLMRKACDCAEQSPSRCLGDDEYVTQFAELDDYRNRPRPNFELDVSVVRGQMSGVAAYELMLGRSPGQQGETLLARHATAGTLRAAGFAVVHTPIRKRSRSALHVSIMWPGDWPTEAPQPWTNTVAEAFGRCMVWDRG